MTLSAASLAMIRDAARRELQRRDMESTALTIGAKSDIINPHERQRQFLEALKDHGYVLYGGAAGGGKSYILRWGLVALLLWWAKQGHEGVHVGLFSMDYPTLHDRQLSKIRREMPDWLGSFKEKDREFILKDEFGGGVLAFRNLDDPSKYKSAEFAAIAVEELTEHEEDVFDDLRWRLRWPGIGTTRFLGATNPTGVGMHWVKRLWIDRDFPEHLQDKADQFCYIPAKANDNPHNDVSYIGTLDSLPPQMRAALRDGSWDVFAGQVFTEFRRDQHVCQPFAIPEWWSVWGCNDPGYNETGAWYIQAADQDGGVYVVREWSFANREKTYSQQARQVADDLQEAGIKPTYWVTGMDAFNSHPETGKSIVDYYQEGGLYGFQKPVHGPGARKQMAATMHEYLLPVPNSAGKLDPRLKVFSCCERLIKTLPMLPADENKPEQVAECAIDHWYQAAGYGLQSRHITQSKDNRPPKPYKPGTLGALAGLGQEKRKPKLADPFAR